MASGSAVLEFMAMYFSNAMLSLAFSAGVMTFSTCCVGGTSGIGLSGGTGCGMGVIIGGCSTTCPNVSPYMTVTPGKVDGIGVCIITSPTKGNSTLHPGSLKSISSTTTCVGTSFEDDDEPPPKNEESAENNPGGCEGDIVTDEWLGDE